MGRDLARSDYFSVTRKSKARMAVAQCRLTRPGLTYFRRDTEAMGGYSRCEKLAKRNEENRVGYALGTGVRAANGAYAGSSAGSIVSNTPTSWVKSLRRKGLTQ
jgi:hypothetical protein